MPRSCDPKRKNWEITYRSSISRYLVAYYAISIVSTCFTSQNIPVSPPHTNCP